MTSGDLSEPGRPLVETAIVLSDLQPSAKDAQIVGVLDFFGIASRRLQLADWTTEDHPPDGASRARLFCSSDVFAQLLGQYEAEGDGIHLCRDRVHSVFVYGGQEVQSLQTVVRRITNDPAARILEDEPAVMEWALSDASPEFCGPMSGIRVPAVKGDRRAEFGGVAAERIISGHGSAAFFRGDCYGIPVFVCVSSRIVDLDEPLRTGNFDIRDHFISAVPIVLYTKWAFSDVCWKSPTTGACVVIDDPLLSRRYGFLIFSDLLDVMKRHGFSTNIAFIPWNWRRSTSTVARLFAENQPSYSLSIHGCDHTAGEFGTRDLDLLAWKARLASDRMSRHQSRTGIQHDHVMVFPQGVFSDAAMSVLKSADFIGTVNTEVISTDGVAQTIRTSDVWDVAVMSYHDFPLFTRRYPSQGIANFAFDILLGKPCLVVIHHDYCRDQYKHLSEFVEQLNALNCRLSWTNLGDVVRGACRQRELSTDVVEIEMYASESVLANHFEQRKRFVVKKRECEPSAVKDVLVDSEQTAWQCEAGELRLALDLNPGQVARVCVRFRESVPGNQSYPQGLRYKVKTLLRRVASEARDNYWARITASSM